jgi:hypothetical protein
LLTHCVVMREQIIPFCMDSCYEAPPSSAPTTVVIQAQNPVAAAPTVNIINSQSQSPMQQQPPQMIMQQQPPMSMHQPPPVIQQPLPVVAAVEAPTKGGPQALDQFLEGLNLTQYNLQLRELGALEVVDLADVTEEEFAAVSSSVVSTQPCLHCCTCMAWQHSTSNQPARSFGQMGMKPLEMRRLVRGISGVGGVTSL